MFPIKIDFVTFHQEERINNKLKWLGICDCGNQTSFLKNYIKITRRGKLSCGCQHNRKIQRGNKSANWRGYGDISGEFWINIRNSAKLRNIPFNITIEEAWEIFINQDQRCKLTNLPIQIQQTRKLESLKGNASLDRVNSNLPYTKENVQWVHKDVQKFKYIVSQEYFIQTCKEIVKWNKL